MAYAPYRWIRSRRSYHSLTSIDLRPRGMVSASICSETGSASRAGIVTVSGWIAGTVGRDANGVGRTCEGDQKSERGGIHVEASWRVLARAELV